jgi:plasmid stabilization system protein ParE
MTLFRFAPQASVDLFDVWRYIAADNPEAADLVEDAIYDACALISEKPFIGQIRKELTLLPLRFWTVQQFPNYVIVYDPKATPIQIIRILHGKRDVKRILDRL